MSITNGSEVIKVLFDFILLIKLISKYEHYSNNEYSLLINNIVKEELSFL